MRAPARLHHVGLSGESGEPGGWPPPLHVNEHTRGLSHGGIADVFHHEREARSGRDRKSLGATPNCALQSNRGSELVFHLDKAATDGGNASGKTFNYLGGRCDGITGREPCSRSQRAFATGMVAIDKMRTGENAARISFHRPFPSPIWHWLPGFRKWRNPDSTFRTGRIRCISRAQSHAAGGSPWS